MGSLRFFVSLVTSEFLGPKDTPVFSLASLTWTLKTQGFYSCLPFCQYPVVLWYLWETVNTHTRARATEIIIGELWKLQKSINHVSL